MLEGITILDLTQQLPGPYATMLLRHMGARVIKLEPPGGDVSRIVDPWMFSVLNAGKQCITLDLRSEAGQRVMNRLVRHADIFLEGFRPGVADRLGISYVQLASLHPRLIYCSISGFGQEGPYRDVPGHDLNYFGIGGGLGGACEPRELDSDGEMIGMPVVDLAAGTTAALSVLAALRHRERTGEGSYLDIAMLDQAVFWSCIKAGWALGNSHRTTPPPKEAAYGHFRAADGRYLTVAVIEDKFWAELCKQLGWMDWLTDPGLATYSGRLKRAPEVIERLKKVIGERPREEWLSLLMQAGLPVGPVHTFAEVPSDPQVMARAIFQKNESGENRLRPPLPLGWGVSDTEGAPARGQDQAAILDELGFTLEEQCMLAKAGAFGRETLG